MLLVSGAAFALASASQAKDVQPNAYQSRDVPVGAFQRLEVSGPFKVGVVVQDGPAHVSLTGPSALLADTIAKVDGDTLSIRFREGAAWSWNPGSGVNIVVSAPSLVSARVRGAAEVEVSQAHGETFSASTEGSGSIALRGFQARQVKFATGGSGGITAEGKAADASYAVSGSGSIDAKRLRVTRASIAVGGSGSVSADVSRTADVSVVGSGRVEVVGVATCIWKRATGPQVECR
jgi:hypothetical protein